MLRTECKTREIVKVFTLKLSTSNVVGVNLPTSIPREKSRFQPLSTPHHDLGKKACLGHTVMTNIVC